MPQFRRTAITVIVSLTGAASATLAQPAPPVEQTLPEVRVNAEPPEETPYGPDVGYKAGRSATATKTDTPLAETPESITVVTRERIEDQGATSLQDALNYAAGIRSDAYGLDTRSDNIRVRGGYPVEYRDGLRRQLGGFYTSTTRVEPYSLERIEVLRGPAALLYGQGSTAGVVNMVSKRPLAEPYREIGVQLGNFGRKQLQADMTGPLSPDGEWRYRLVAVGRDSDTQVDYVRDDRKLFAPSLTWAPSGATTLTLQALWQDDRSGSTSQFFPWSGTLLPNPNGRLLTDRFIGEPGLDRYDSARFEAGWLFEHHFNAHWTVRQNTRYTRNRVDYFTLYGDSFTNPGMFSDPAQRVLDRFGYFENRKVRALTADQHLEGRFDTGAVQHRVLVGAELVSHRENTRLALDNPVSLGGMVPPIDAYSPVYGGYSPPALSDQPESTQRMAGVYLQDQIRLGKNLIAVAGVRRDRAESQVEGAPDEADSATSRRAGLMYRFANGIAPYLSYSESFTPLAGVDLSARRWKPLRGEQNEVGVKYQPPGERFAINAALYELREKNRQVSDPANPINQVQVGVTRTTGFELEAVGQLLQLIDIAAHYNYTSIDDQLEALPRHQAAIWATHRFPFAALPGVIAGFGARYMSAFTDGAAPETPAVTLFDAMLGYDSGHWRYTLHVQNITDKTYVATCLGRGDCWYGARRTVVASARYRF